MLFGLLAPAALGNQRHPFTDVPENTFPDGAVQFLWERGIMVGTSPTEFSPHANLTRAMMTTILYRVAGEPTTSFRNVFADVPDNRWYSVPITWAHDNDVANGVGNNRFAPSGNLTREQLAAMMYRYAVSQEWNVGVPSGVQAPANTSTWAREYVRWAFHHRFLLDGVPSGTATRGQTAYFVYRFIQYYGALLPQSGDIDQLTRDGATWSALSNRGFSRIEIQGAFEREVFRLSNVERANYGIAPLQWHEGLTVVSRDFSRDMYTRDFFSHTCPDGGTPWDRMAAAGITGWGWAGENLFAGPRTPRDAVNGWMNSPGHRANILAPGATHLGVGFYNFFWTQKFIAVDTSSPQPPQPPQPPPQQPEQPREPMNISNLRGQNFADVRHLLGTNPSNPNPGVYQFQDAGISVTVIDGKIIGMFITFGRPGISQTAFHFNGIDGTFTPAAVRASLGAPDQTIPSLNQPHPSYQYNFADSVLRVHFQNGSVSQLDYGIRF